MSSRTNFNYSSLKQSDLKKEFPKQGNPSEPSLTDESKISSKSLKEFSKNDQRNTGKPTSKFESKKPVRVINIDNPNKTTETSTTDEALTQKNQARLPTENERHKNLIKDPPKHDSLLKNISNDKPARNTSKIEKNQDLVTLSENFSSPQNYGVIDQEQEYQNYLEYMKYQENLDINNNPQHSNENVDNNEAENNCSSGNTSHTSSNLKTRNIIFEDIKNHDSNGKCADHPTEDIQYYCFTNEQCLCVECMLEGRHSNHDVQSIRKSRERMQQRTEEVFMEIRTKIDLLIINEKKLLMKKNEFEDVVGQANNLITSNFDELRKAIDKKEHELIKATSSHLKQKFWEIDTCAVELKDRYDALTQLYGIIDKHSQTLDDQIYCDYLSKKLKKIYAYIQEEDNLKIDDILRLDKVRCIIDNASLKQFIQNMECVKLDLINQKGLTNTSNDEVSKIKLLQQKGASNSNGSFDSFGFKDLSNNKFKEVSETFKNNNVNDFESEERQNISQHENQNISSPNRNYSNPFNGKSANTIKTSLKYDLQEKMQVNHTISQIRNGGVGSPTNESISVESYLENKYKDIFDATIRPSLSPDNIRPNATLQKLQKLAQSLKISPIPISKLESTPFSKRNDGFSIKKSSETFIDKSPPSIKKSNMNHLMMSIKKPNEKESTLSNVDSATRNLRTSFKNFYGPSISHIKDSDKKNKAISSMLSPRMNVENNAVLSLLGRQKAEFFNKKVEIQKN